MKSHDNPFYLGIFSSLSLLYFVNQVVTQMRWAVSYPDDFMYRLILYIIYFSFIIFHFSRIYFPTKITHVTMPFTLPKMFHENVEGFQQSFLIDHVRFVRKEQY